MLVVLVVLANRAFQVYQTWQTHVCIPSLVNLISVMIRWTQHVSAKYSSNRGIPERVLDLVHFAGNAR